MFDHHSVSQVARASAIATIAHRGAVDKLGAPYIEHPSAVAALFHPEHEWFEISVAWLHDVIEDTDVTAADLVAAGIDPAIVDAVELLTRTGKTDADYYAAIRENPAALAVKLADITHNTNPSRMARLDPATRERLTAKYAAAEEALR